MMKKKSGTSELTEKILELLRRNPDKFYKTKELARTLGISPRKYSSFRNHLKKLVEKGDIIREKSNLYGLPKPRSVVEGKLVVKAQGFGFLLMPEGEQDIFISANNLGLGLNGDTVKVQLFATTRGKRPEGRVIEVLERGHRYIVGTLRKGKYYHFVVPDDLRITRDIYIHDSDLNGAEAGQKVAAEIVHWDDEFLNPEGRIVKIIGFPGEPGVDVMSVVASYELPLDFPEEVQKEVEAVPVKIPRQEIKRRLDLRDVVCFTIDPEDAKDFDDAVSLARLENGNYELGVHIADVSYYVRPGMAADREALARGTSVYLVDRVVPMLPERLSNEICSLKPETDRLTYSCLMEVTPAGEVISYDIRETVIHSNKRFTYQDVQAFWDGRKTVAPDLATPLNQMRELARTLRRKRMLNGSLNFDTPEAKVILDKKGTPIDIRRQVTLESMQMIEEFMLLANKTVAWFVEGLRTDEGTPPFIYRIHEKPSSEKMQKFSEFLEALGFKVKLTGRVTSKNLSTFLNKIRGTNEELVIENVMLRSLMKARYDTDNAGHFGLAFKFYTHFTSPIRRYADLEVHRLLKLYTADGWQEKIKPGLEKKLDDICQQISEREVVAQEAERTSVKMKQVQFMADKLGEDFDGIISGVVHFGIFVEIVDYLVEGLVHISDLDGVYEFEEKTYTLRSVTTNHAFRIGDPVRVKVVRADPDESVIDFILVEKKERKQKRAKSRSRKARAAK